jgi:acyl-CoA reductase-like NAD-dependent aldehyde dehydrogenase
VPERLSVRKTYKLFLGGEFPRSESGRSYEVVDAKGEFLANATRASRKDLRDAVKVARAAWGKWAGATAYNRGQVLYRIAEMMETRRAELVAEVGDAEGRRGATKQVDEAIDTWVWYAGLADKLTQIMGGLNPVAGPYFNLTAPEPTGVCGIVAPEAPSLAGLVSRVAPALCGGNVVVALTSEGHPLPAIALAECLATSDLPKGVANILTGYKAELTPWLASHGDVDALDVTGVPSGERVDVERAGSDNVKRIIKSDGARSPYQASAFMEMKTVWHPKGA